MAVSVSDTTTTTQGNLNLDFTLSTAGNIVQQVMFLDWLQVNDFAGLQTRQFPGGAPTPGTPDDGAQALTVDLKQHMLTWQRYTKLIHEYEPGTIVMFGGDKEVTIAQGLATTKVAGVITDSYAFLMNQEAKGQP